MKFVNSNSRMRFFYHRYFYLLSSLRLKVIGSMESHRSERSTRRMHELLAIRWKSWNQISRNQFSTYSRFFFSERYENCIVRLMVLFHLVALLDFIFAFETEPNAAALVATIFLPCILCRSIQKTIVIFKQHSMFLSYSFCLLNRTLNENFVRWKRKWSIYTK